MGSLSISSLAEAIVETRQDQSQAPHGIQEPNRHSSQRSAQELAGPDLLVCNRSTSRRFDAPEAVLYTEMEGQQLIEPNSEPNETGLTSYVCERRPLVVTFYCKKAISCEGYCSCVCHASRRYKSPGLLNSLIGSLFIGYSGFPILSKKCDLATCADQTSRSVRASYTFPAWFVMKTLDFVAKSSSTSGLCFNLRLRNKISQGAGTNIISLARNGAIPTIRKLLEKGQASLTDTDSLGFSPFCVRGL